jgi:phosphate transport system permease protein
MHAPDASKFSRKNTRAAWTERVAFWLFRAGTYALLAAGAAVFLVITIKGAPTVFTARPPFVNVEFLTRAPETLHVFKHEGREMSMGDREFRGFTAAHGLKNVEETTYVYSAGGIFPCIAGTVLLVTGAMTIALVLGVASAIFLSEYSAHGPVSRVIRLAIMNLAGVPSIVFGLFGLGMFVLFFKWNVSLMSGWFTLAFMVLPVIITAAEESLRAVPQGFREGALALGATKWQAIRTNVLPYAMPGILTSSVLGISRVAGETAPIMFTAAYVVRDRLPWQVAKFSDFFFQGVMALPYHIYVVSSKIPQNEYSERVQYGATFVFLAVVVAISLVSVVLRARLRSRLKW